VGAVVGGSPVLGMARQALRCRRDLGTRAAVIRAGSSPRSAARQGPAAQYPREGRPAGTPRAAIPTGTARGGRYWKWGHGTEGNRAAEQDDQAHPLGQDPATRRQTPPTKTRSGSPGGSPRQGRKRLQARLPGGVDAHRAHDADLGNSIDVRSLYCRCRPDGRQ